MEVYDHFKGKAYIKLTEGLDTETNEVKIVYVCTETGKVFIRSKSMFNENVYREDYAGKRFVKREDI